MVRITDNSYNIYAIFSLKLAKIDHQVRMPARSFTFVLLPGFSMLALSGAIDVLRAANLCQAPEQHYRWKLTSADKREVCSSSGVFLPTAPISDDDTPAVIVVCGGENADLFNSSRLQRWLTQQNQPDRMIGSLSDAAFVVADYGLFDGYRSTIHWQCLEQYRLKYPQLDIRASILEIDRNRFSCAGGTSSIDLMLHFIRDDLGSEAVIKISENYFHDTVRGSEHGQTISDAYRYAGKSRLLSEALAYMSASLDQPLSIKKLSEQIGTSHRTMDRLFQTHLNTSPARHLRALRLARAATLLKQTGLPVSDVALNCGFTTASHLGRYFREQYGKTPVQFRKQ